MSKGWLQKAAKEGGLYAEGSNEGKKAMWRSAEAGVRSGACAAHQRGWLQPALRTLPTRSILAHLSFNARPILGAGAAANLSNADLGLADDVGAVQKRGKKRKA